jgi:hypothetical protein
MLCARNQRSTIDVSAHLFVFQRARSKIKRPEAVVRFSPAHGA